MRYLQDNIIAYHDQTWDDGDILLDYRCTPGTAVDRYRLGYSVNWRTCSKNQLVSFSHTPHRGGYIV